MKPKMHTINVKPATFTLFTRVMTARGWGPADEAVRRLANSELSRIVAEQRKSPSGGEDQK